MNVATVARALVLLWNESARVVDPDDYRLYTWADWAQLRPEEGEAFIQAVRTRLRVPEVIVLASTTGCRGRGQLQPPQHLQAGPLDVPVLRRAAGRRGADDRPRCAAFAGWRLDLGELRAGVRRLQQAERPTARRQQAGMKLRKEPVRPAWKPLYARSSVRIESWSKFVSEAYWNVTLES